jgi:hypothetical protein
VTANPNDAHLPAGVTPRVPAETPEEIMGCGLGAPATCDEAYRDDKANCCDPCLGDDPDCKQLEADPCPEAWRDDALGFCDTCLGDDPDCTDAPVVQDNCGDVTYEGTCNQDGSLSFCDTGQVVTESCGSCGYVEDIGLYMCI